MVTVASELNADDMVLQRRKRRAVSGPRANGGRTKDSTEGKKPPIDMEPRLLQRGLESKTFLMECRCVHLGD